MSQGPFPFNWFIQAMRSVIKNQFPLSDILLGVETLVPREGTKFKFSILSRSPVVAREHYPFTHNEKIVY